MCQHRETYDTSMGKAIPGPWVRRPTAVVGLSVAIALSPIIAPIAVVSAYIIDHLRKESHLPRTRGAALVSGLVFVDFLGMVRTSTIWVSSAFGLRADHPKIQARYSKTMNWWTARLNKVMARFIPLSFDFSQLDDDLLAGNAIVIGRHRSLLDAIIPAVVFGRLGRVALYVLKNDLQRDINIDLVGSRMGHVFVNRSPKDLKQELEPIRELGSRIGSNSIGVIFPEGTFFTPQRKARALASLRRRNERHAAIVEKMQYLLPPRPAGTLALLEGAPTADVVMLGHVGYEPFGTIAKIFSELGPERKILVRAWRFARSDIPTDPTAQVDWLFDRWAEMDEWIRGEQQVYDQTRSGTSPDH